MGGSAADGGAKGQTPSDPAAPAAPAQSARAADDVPEGFVVLANRSPYGRLIGPVYEKATPEGRVFGVRIAEKHVNLGGIAHGGMMASFADVVLGQFESRDYSRVTVTVRMVTDYVAASRLGDWLEGRATVTKETGSMVFVDATIACRSHLVLRASGVFKLLKRKW